MPPADWVQRRQQATARWQSELLRRGATFEIGSKSCRQRSRSSCASAAGLWGLYSRVQASTRACSNLTGDELSWAGWDVPPALLERSVLTAGGAAEDSGLGEPRLYQRLLVKLERGDPITVLTLGSSVVGAHAGCTHALPHLGKCPCPRCCGSRCGRWGGGGWGLKLLSYINASWPHPGHRLYNLGEPGGDFMPSLLACPKTYLTFDADLVLLDFFTAYHKGVDVLTYERVLPLTFTAFLSLTAHLSLLTSHCSPLTARLSLLAEDHGSFHLSPLHAVIDGRSSASSFHRLTRSAHRQW